MEEWVNRFLADTWVQIVLLLIALDLALGVLAALKNRTFDFGKVADFLLDDVLGKVVPMGVLYAGYVFASQHDILIGGFDLKGAAYAGTALATAALVKSLATSLGDLGLEIPVLGKRGPDLGAPPA